MDGWRASARPESTAFTGPSAVGFHIFRKPLFHRFPPLIQCRAKGNGAPLGFHGGLDISCLKLSKSQGVQEGPEGIDLVSASRGFSSAALLGGVGREIPAAGTDRQGGT